MHEETVERARAGQNPFGREFKQLQRYHQAHSFDTELDASGRVTLPPPLLSHAGVKKDVVVAGVGDHLEIWARERWREEQPALEADIEEVTSRLGHSS